MTAPAEESLLAKTAGGAGWVIVFGILTGRTLRTVLSYIMRPYRPRLTLAAWRQIIGFTMWSWGTYTVSMLRDRVGTILVGRFFSPAGVGIYALGGEIASLPSSELVDPLCRACFPSFSQLHNSGVGVAQTYLRLLGATTLLVLPAGVGIAMVADPLVRVAFGPKWREAIPLIQILGISACIGALGGITGTLFSAYGMLRTTAGAEQQDVEQSAGVDHPLQPLHGEAVLGQQRGRADSVEESQMRAVEQSLVLMRPVPLQQQRQHHQGVPDMRQRHDERAARGQPRHQPTHHGRRIDEVFQYIERQGQVEHRQRVDDRRGFNTADDHLVERRPGGCGVGLRQLHADGQGHRPLRAQAEGAIEITPARNTGTGTAAPVPDSL